MTIRNCVVMVLMIVGLTFTTPLLAENSATQGDKAQDKKLQEKADQIKNQMLSDPESMKFMLQMQNDPNMQAILYDPELLKAVQEQDLARVAQDPKIQKLLNNPKLKELAKKNQ